MRADRGIYPGRARAAAPLTGPLARVPVAGNDYVYIVASLSRTICVGMSNELGRRVRLHRHRLLGGSTASNVDRRVYFEHAMDVNAAIAREAELKRWSRA
ncbi:MAG TPA: GIY-YIG nuclease family protein [Longimicrobium sp.]